MTSNIFLSIPQAERIVRAIRDIELLLSEWRLPLHQPCQDALANEPTAPAGVDPGLDCPPNPRRAIVAETSAIAKRVAAGL